jgi:hypothetical protein
VLFLSPPSPSLPQSYFEMVRLCFLFYSDFFYSFPCFFVDYSVIYHCFPPASYIGPFPFFVPLFVPIQYLPSILFDPLHQSLPLCIPYIFSSQFLPPLSPILPLSIRSSLFPFIACSKRLLVVFISLLHIVHLFLYMRSSSSAFSCRFSLIPSFTPVIISPVARKN